MDHRRLCYAPGVSVFTLGELEQVMNNRQKLGYMALGASVLAVGIGYFLIIASCSHEHEILAHEHEISAHDHVIDTPAQFVEASYEIVASYELVEGVFYRITDNVLNWTIRFDKPPQALQVTNAEEYTLLGGELHITTEEWDEDIIVVWDGGKKIFSDPFALTAGAFNAASGIFIEPYPGSTVLPEQEFLVEFRKRREFVDVDVIDATIHGIRATEFDKEWANERSSNWSAVVNLPKGSHSVKAIWMLSNGIEGFQTFSPYIVE